MKNLAKSVIFVITAMLISSCKEDDSTGLGTSGFLSFNISLNIDSESISGRTSTGDPNEFYVAVHDVNDVVVVSYPRLADAPAFVELPIGEYYVVAHSDNYEEAAFENPYYYGRSQNFTIDKEEEKTVDITAELANTKVSFHYSNEVLNTFNAYSASVEVVSSGTTLDFVQGEAKEGYFVSEPLNVEVNLSYTKLDGSTIDRTFTASIDAQPKTLYRINVDASLQDGQIVFNLIVDETFDVEEIELGEETSDLPLIGTTWTLITYEVAHCNNSMYNGVYQCESDCEILFFNEDGTFVSTDPDYSFPQFTYTYEVEGDTVTLITSDGPNDFLDINYYEIVGDELLLTEGIDPYTGCIHLETYKGTSY